MTIERKVGMGIAGQPSGDAPDVAEVFSTDLYTGTGSGQAITNGIDLAGEGGLVWIKWRSGNATAGNNTNNILVDTENGTSKYLEADTANGATSTAALSSFNSNGFTTGGAISDVDNSGDKYASWTFRNSKKFFKAVTFSYGGSSSSPTVVTHDLGCTVGMAISKITSSSGGWYVQHHSITGSGNNGLLNDNGNFTLGNGYDTTFSSITDTTATFGAAASFPAGTYVAYFFADNSSELADNQMIKCGSYVGNATFNGGPEINLGWEPQWLLIKNGSENGNWFIYDSMRGIVTGRPDPFLYANGNAGESSTTGMTLQPTGFQITGNNAGENGNNQTYIYMAIRAPMMKEPTAGTDVYNAVERTGTNSADTVVVNFAPDLVINRRNDDGENGDAETWDRLRGRPAMISTNSVNVETLYGNAIQDLVSFNSTGISLGLGTYAQINYSNRQNIIWFFKRAKGFFDIVCYTGNATAGRTVSHNLGAKPQLILAKTRDAANYWVTYDEASGATKHMQLNDGGGSTASIDHWNNTEPTSSVITLGDGNYTNRNSTKQIMYMFASVEGVSKVGSYTGTGSQQTIDCGFSNGARFVLTKCTTHNIEWMVHDTTRGIVSGNDKRLTWSTTSPQVGSSDEIDPHSSGFILDTQGDMNLSGRTYIFLAIA